MSLILGYANKNNAIIMSDGRAVKMEVFQNFIIRPEK